MKETQDDAQHSTAQHSIAASYVSYGIEQLKRE